MMEIQSTNPSTKWIPRRLTDSRGNCIHTQTHRAGQMFLYIARGRWFLLVLLLLSLFSCFIDEWYALFDSPRQGKHSHRYQALVMHLMIRLSLSLFSFLFLLLCLARKWLHQFSIHPECINFFVSHQQLAKDCVHLISSRIYFSLSLCHQCT